MDFCILQKTVMPDLQLSDILWHLHQRVGSLERQNRTRSKNTLEITGKNVDTLSEMEHFEETRFGFRKTCRLRRDKTVKNSNLFSYKVKWTLLNGMTDNGIIDNGIKLNQMEQALNCLSIAYFV